MPRPGSPCPAPGEGHLQGNPSAGEGTLRLLLGILALQTVAARSPHSPAGRANSCPGHSVPGASDRSWQRERFQVVSQRRPAGNARVLSTRPRATYCPCGQRRGPRPGPWGFSNSYEFFTSPVIAAEESRGQDSKQRSPESRRGGPCPAPAGGPACLAGPAHSLPACATLTAGWAPCGPSLWTQLGLGAGQEGALPALAELPEPLCCRVTFWAATHGLEAPPCVPLGGQHQVKVPRASGVTV